MVLNTLSTKVDFPPPAMGFPTPQGRDSPTFSPPPIDGSLCVPEIYKYHATHSPHHPLFIYADDTSDASDLDDKSTTKTITYSYAWRMILRAAKIVKKHYERLEHEYAKQDRATGMIGMPQRIPPTIGILANAGKIFNITVSLGFGS